jgi:hypothetical protein
VASATWAAILAGGLGRLATAARGWDVPRDALALVHKDEMILPPALAENIRRLSSGPPGGPSQVIIPLTINQVNDRGQITAKNRYGLTVDIVNKAIKHREITVPPARRR